VKKTKIFMGSVRQSLQAQPKNIKKLSKHQKISNKSMFSEQREQMAKIRMGVTRRSLQAQPKILEKLSKYQIYQSGRKFFQKKNAQYLKRGQKLIWGLPDGICRLTPKSLKKLLEYQIYQSKQKFS
jgi:hypothetical protein